VGAFRDDDRSFPFRSSSCGGADDGAPAGPSEPARVVTLDDGTRWLVTVVARLVSEDTLTGCGSARLIVRIDSVAQSGYPARVASVRARALHSVDEETLRALTEPPESRDYQPPHRSRA
jgi:hypothetical protein